MVSLHDVLVVCLCSICMCPSESFGIEKAALYIKRDTFEIKKSTLALLNPQEVTLMECGHLCLDDNCCKGFMYNEISKHCVGLQFKDFDCTVNLNPTFSDIEGILPYQKGCETGWLEFNGHCYYAIKGQSKVQWSEAKTQCRTMCSYLVEIDSKEEADWISSIFLEDENCPTNIFDCTAWIGLNDREVEGTFIWDHSNAALNFTNWYPGEPSMGSLNEAKGKDCVDILRGGLWNDRFCSFLNWAICEKDIGL
ncbi:collectin-12-like [Crassostrea virginica]